MISDMYLPALMWLAIGALTGWIAAPLMRLRRGKMLMSIAVGMVGAFVGGVLISWLKSVAEGDPAGAGPATLLFVFACAGMMLATIPRSRYGSRSQRAQVESGIDAFLPPPR